MDDTTWSQKYNLVWDKILKLNLIPQAVFDTEIAFYSKNFAKYGLRLDNRKDLTKTDWFMWTGAFGDDAYQQLYYSPPLPPKKKTTLSDSRPS